MKRIALMFALVGGLIFGAPIVNAPVFDSTPAVACGTGGSSTQYKHCHKSYSRSCNELGNPRPGCYGPQRHGRSMHHPRRVIVHPPVHHHIYRGHGYRYGAAAPAVSPVPPRGVVDRVCNPCPTGGRLIDPINCTCRVYF
jgi:hypothetical protein